GWSTPRAPSAASRWPSVSPTSCSTPTTTRAPRSPRRRTCTRWPRRTAPTATSPGSGPRRTPCPAAHAPPVLTALAARLRVRRGPPAGARFERASCGGYLRAVSASPGHIRNLGIVAHINAGKTTLSERILYDSGRVRFLGEVDEGTAALDYLPEEQRRGISIRSASTSVPWRGRLLNLVDTPGHVDFGAEVVRCLRVVDGVVLVLDGVRGVEPRTEAVWQQVRTLDLAALAFVNKLDRPVASWRRALDAVVARLGVRALPAVVPIAGETGLTGLIDVVTGKAVEWAPGGTAQADPARARADLVEAA